MAECAHDRVALSMVDPDTWTIQCMAWDCLRAWPVDEAPLDVLRQLAAELDRIVQRRTATAN